MGLSSAVRTRRQVPNSTEIYSGSSVSGAEPVSTTETAQPTTSRKLPNPRPQVRKRKESRKQSKPKRRKQEPSYQWPLGDWLDRCFVALVDEATVPLIADVLTPEATNTKRKTAARKTIFLWAKFLQESQVELHAEDRLTFPFKKLKAELCSCKSPAHLSRARGQRFPDTIPSRKCTDLGRSKFQEEWPPQPSPLG